VTDTAKNLKIAVVQAAPIFMNRDETVDKACSLIADAAKGGASLVVMPEAFVPGYPDWVWVVPGAKKPILDAMYTRLLNNSVSIGDDATTRLCKAAREAGVYVTIGINERNSEASNASLFNTLLYIGPDGQVLGRHRKLMPTGPERIVWAQGDGSTLNVYDTSIGRLGGLLCWENYMPLARAALYEQGAQIHVAPTWDSSPVWLATMQHIAKEGGMFVAGCCTAMHVDAIPDQFEFKALYPDGKEWVNAGNSCVVGPKGNIIAGPVKAEETILYADLDLDEIPGAKWIFDSAGHYARRDVFEFAVRTENRQGISPTVQDEPGANSAPSDTD
jgi:nitrilase